MPSKERGNLQRSFLRLVWDNPSILREKVLEDIRDSSKLEEILSRAPKVELDLSYFQLMAKKKPSKEEKKNFRGLPLEDR
jgi:hypothetical protein